MPASLMTSQIFPETEGFLVIATLDVADEALVVDSCVVSTCHSISFGIGEES